MTCLQRVACLVGSAAALVMSASGCDPYTYFNVHVTLQQQGANAVDSQTQNLISACKLFVLADGKLIENEQELKTIQGPTACRHTLTPIDIGVLDYSTARTSGKLSFMVNMMDTADVSGSVIVQGTTQAEAVDPGHVEPTLELVAGECGRGSQPACAPDPQP